MRSRTRTVPLSVIAGFGVVILASCSTDGPTSAKTAPSAGPAFALSLFVPPAAVAGQIQVCKSWDGTAGGNTTINAAAATGTPTLLGPAILGNGQCAVIATSAKPDAAGNNNDNVTLTEAIPANSTLEGAVAINENGVATPYLNGSTALFINTYHGFTVTFTNVLRTIASEGCSPGYYKRHVQPTSGSKIASVFANSGYTTASGQPTLQDALAFRGGPSLQDAKNVLLRQAAAAYFNSLRLSGYPLTTAQVIAGVNTALATNDRNAILAYAAILDGYNNLEGPNC